MAAKIQKNIQSSLKEAAEANIAEAGEKFNKLFFLDSQRPLDINESITITFIVNILTIFHGSFNVRRKTASRRLTYTVNVKSA